MPTFAKLSMNAGQSNVFVYIVVRAKGNLTSTILQDKVQVKISRGRPARQKTKKNTIGQL